jgi:hypothetical protein
MLFLPALAQTSAQASPITLTHVFSAGEKFGYQVLSHITAEERFEHLDTWIPSDLDVNYNFGYTVNQMRPDGIAVVHYLRPTMTEVIGETSDSPPKDEVEKVNIDNLLTVSPINEILEQKNVGKKEALALPYRRHAYTDHQENAMSFFAPYIMDIHRLALFIGSVEDALDFSPKFPLNAVKKGDSWKKTVGFEPQRLKGKVGKVAIQRIDYTYTYLGPMSSNGKPVLRVEGKLAFSTDAAEFFKQLLGEHASETNVAKVPLHFDSVIDFDLDPTTRDVLHAEGKTSGGYQVFTTESTDTALLEERFKGKTTMELTGKRAGTK